MFAHLTLLPHLGRPTNSRRSRRSTACANCARSASRPTRSSCAPDVAPDPDGAEGEDRALLRRRGAERRAEWRRGDDLPRAAQPRGRRSGRDRDPQAQLDVPHPPHLEEWAKIVERIENPKLRVKIALVGKYVELKDAYISISEAINHAGIFHDAQVEVVRVDSERIETEGWARSKACTGCSSPGFRRARRQRQADGDPVRARSRRFRSSASASACSWRASSSRATSAASPTRRRAKSARRRPMP